MGEVPLYGEFKRRAVQGLPVWEMEMAACFRALGFERRHPTGLRVSGLNERYFFFFITLKPRDE